MGLISNDGLKIAFRFERERADEVSVTVANVFVLREIAARLHTVGDLTQYTRNFVIHVVFKRGIVASELRAERQRSIRHFVSPLFG
jgi:hypothetical protein